MEVKKILRLFNPNKKSSTYKPTYNIQSHHYINIPSMYTVISYCKPTYIKHNYLRSRLKNRPFASTASAASWWRRAWPSSSTQASPSSPDPHTSRWQPIQPSLALLRRWCKHFVTGIIGRVHRRRRKHTSLGHFGLGFWVRDH